MCLCRSQLNGCERGTSQWGQWCPSLQPSCFGRIPPGRGRGASPSVLLHQCRWESLAMFNSCTYLKTIRLFSSTHQTCNSLLYLMHVTGPPSMWTMCHCRWLNTLCCLLNLQILLAYTQLSSLLRTARRGVEKIRLRYTAGLAIQLSLYDRWCSLSATVQFDIVTHQSAIDWLHQLTHCLSCRWGMEMAHGMVHSRNGNVLWGILHFLHW